jgi:hypothetical protein
MLPYHPALRFKQGEYLAGARIPRNMQRHIEPLFIIPPPKERDPEKGAPLTVDELAFKTGDRIAKHWPLYRAYLDPQYVAPFLRDEGLVRMFQIAQKSNPNLIAVATVSALHNPIYRGFLRPAWPRLAIHLPFGEVDGDALRAGLAAIGCRAEDCVVFLDFTGADLTPDLAVGAVSGTIDSLAEIAPWGRIVFLGSNYPTTNPAPDDGEVSVPRNEWLTYQRAAKDCNVSPDKLGYGDFGADCGEIKFPKSGKGGMPIPHVRYTTATDTIVVRGNKTSKRSESMRKVFSRLLSGGSFAGQGFSYADRNMWLAANGAGGCGGPTEWREWNMAHHMVRVIRDLGAMVGLTFEEGPVTAIAEQGVLFETE